MVSDHVLHVDRAPGASRIASDHNTHAWIPLCLFLPGLANCARVMVYSPHSWRPLRRESGVERVRDATASTRRATQVEMVTAQTDRYPDGEMEDTWTRARIHAV